MRFELLADPSAVSPEELSEDLRTLPSWRADKALRYRRFIDQVLCVEAYVLLRRALEKEFGFSGNPEFEYLEFGKPVLKGFPDIHFNLSHCEKGVLCVVDEAPVGCDIEVIPAAVDDDVLRAGFSRAEQDRILAAADSRVEFARLWTEKEAVLKYTGKGLVDDLPSLMSSELVPDGLSFITDICPADGYVYTIASLK